MFSFLIGCAVFFTIVWGTLLALGLWATSRPGGAGGEGLLMFVILMFFLAVAFDIALFVVSFMA